MANALFIRDKKISELVEIHKGVVGQEVVSENPLRARLGFFDNRITYSVSEVAFMTGLSTRTVSRLVATGVLPSRKVGRRRLIFRADIETWFNRKE